MTNGLLAHHHYKVRARLATTRLVCTFRGGAQKQAIAWLHLVHSLSFMEVEPALDQPDPVVIEGVGRSRICCGGTGGQLNTHEIEGKVGLRRYLLANETRGRILPTLLVRSAREATCTCFSAGKERRHCQAERT